MTFEEKLKNKQLKLQLILMHIDSRPDWKYHIIHKTALWDYYWKIDEEIDKITDILRG